MTPPKYNGPDRRNRDELEVKTAFGSIKAGGGQVILVILIVFGFMGLGYMIRDSDMRQVTLMSDARAERFSQVKRIEDAQNEASYIMSRCLLSKQECEKVQIGMPDSLRRKLRNE